MALLEKGIKTETNIYKNAEFIRRSNKNAECKEKEK